MSLNLLLLFVVIVLAFESDYIMIHQHPCLFDFYSVEQKIMLVFLPNYIILNIEIIFLNTFLYI